MSVEPGLRPLSPNASYSCNMQQAGDPGHSNLYVKGLPPDVDQGTLQQLFQAYGAIESCRIVRDVNTGVSKGYGFCKLSSREDAEKAIRAINGSSIRNHVLEVKYADVDAGPAPLGACLPLAERYYVSSIWALLRRP